MVVGIGTCQFLADCSHDLPHSNVEIQRPLASLAGHRSLPSPLNLCPLRRRAHFEIKTIHRWILSDKLSLRPTLWLSLSQKRVLVYFARDLESSRMSLRMSPERFVSREMWPSSSRSCDLEEAM